MQTFMSQVQIISLSTGAILALIREVETAIAFERNPGARARLQDVLRTARTELARRQRQFAPKPPGF